MTKKKKTKPSEEKAQVHQELNGFKIQVDEFGQIQSNLNIDRMNDFLNQNVEDKKLKDRNKSESADN